MSKNYLYTNTWSKFLTLSTPGLTNFDMGSEGQIRVTSISTSVRCSYVSGGRNGYMMWPDGTKVMFVTRL